MLRQIASVFLLGAALGLGACAQEAAPPPSVAAAPPPPVLGSTYTATTPRSAAPSPDFGAAGSSIPPSPVWNIAYRGEPYAFPNEVSGLVLFSDSTPTAIENAVCSALVRAMRFGPNVSPANVRTTFWLSSQPRPRTAYEPKCSQLVRDYNHIVANEIITSLHLPYDNSARLLIIQGNPNGTDANAVAVFIIPGNSPLDAVATIVGQFKTAIIQDPSVIRAFQSAAAQISAASTPTVTMAVVTPNGIQPTAPEAAQASFWSDLWPAIQPAVGELANLGAHVIIAIISNRFHIPIKT
jgi:hypothetical protein